MSKELAVVEKVVKTGKGVDALEKLISSVPDIPTAELVTGFRMANTYSKRIEKFVNAVKKELVNNADQTGRFLEEGVEVDEKGHRYLRGVDNDELKAEKRVFAKFDAEKAVELLEKKDLMGLGCEEQVTCTDPAKAMELVNKIYDKLFHTVESQMAVEQDMEELKTLFEVKLVATEARVEALVALGKIPTEDVEDLMKVSIQYAVKDSKRKK